MSESREGGYKQLISNGGGFKLAFAERDKKHTMIATKAGSIDSLESGDSWAPWKSKHTTSADELEPVCWLNDKELMKQWATHYAKTTLWPILCVY